MPPRDARIADLIVRLTAAGLALERKEYADRTLIEAHPPETFPKEAWPQALAALETADSFGSSDRGEAGQCLWATFRRTNSRRR